MELVARNKTEGGWVCEIGDCRYDREGYHDLLCHLRTEHEVLTIHRVETELANWIRIEVYDVTDTPVETLRMEGVL